MDHCYSTFGTSNVRLLICLAVVLGSSLPLCADPVRKPLETRISGRVTIKDSDASPPPETTVVVLKPGSRKEVAHGQVQSARGDFSILLLEPGTYTLLAHDGGTYKRDILRNQKIVEGNNPPFILKLVKAPAVSKIAGVTTVGGKPLAGATVALYPTECDDSEIEEVTTNERGEYAFSAAPDDYRVAVTTKGNDLLKRVAFLDQTITVLPSHSAKLDLRVDWRGSELAVFGNPVNLRGPAPGPREEVVVVSNDPGNTDVGSSITGTIAFNGAPVPGVTVTANGEGGRSWTTVTDDKGHFRLPALESGSYTVSAEPTGGLSGFRQAGVRVGLVGLATVSVQLVPAGTGAIAQVSVKETERQLLNLPLANHEYLLLIGLGPTTRPDIPSASINGASNPENAYILDGVYTRTSAFEGLANAGVPFAFVNDVVVGSRGVDAEYRTSAGGTLNIQSRSGSNEFHGDLYLRGFARSMVRDAKNFPLTGATSADISAADFGGGLGGPVIKDKLWFFGAFNPNIRHNFYLTQVLHAPARNTATTPFYNGKLTWTLNPRNTITASTLGNFAKIDGFLGPGTLTNANGFGTDQRAFEGHQETGGANYALQHTSVFRPNFVGHFSFGLSSQRSNIIPRSTAEQMISDNLAVLRNGAVLPVVQTGMNFGGATGLVDFVDGRGGSLQRNFSQGPGFGVFSHQRRKDYELSAKLSYVPGKHSIKWGFEWFRSVFRLDSRSSGPDITYGNPLGLPFTNGSDVNQTHGARITNYFLVCAVRAGVINCPSNVGVLLAQAIPAGTLASLGLTVNSLAGPLSVAETLNDPFLIRSTTRVRDFQRVGKTHTSVESFYLQDDYRFRKNWKLSMGARWDFQQALSDNGTGRISLNSFGNNLSPRLGLTWNFGSTGSGLISASYGRFIETPIPLDISVRAAGGDIQADKNFNVNRYGAPANAVIVPGVSTGAVNLGGHSTPVDPGLKPQSTHEARVGLRYEVFKNVVFGVDGLYRYLGQVIEDGSFDDGETYFIFNPGRNEPGTAESRGCAGDPASGRGPRCFGHARRFYRALEFRVSRRMTGKYGFETSYVFSSLIGNYEGLFRNFTAQSDPGVPSLFDLQSLSNNTYGRLRNDQPHQFRLNGTYQPTRRLLIGGDFSAQSGAPFNQFIPHPVYGNNEGFAVPRGTAIVPVVTASPGGFPNIVDSIGSRRAPPTVNLNLQLHYSVMVKERKSLRITGEWFNVLNHQRAVALDQSYLLNSGAVGISPVSNLFWGSALVVQAPSVFRLGARFEF